MTRITGPDCAVMCNLIKHTHTHTHTLTKKRGCDDFQVGIRRNLCLGARVRPRLHATKESRHEAARHLGGGGGVTWDVGYSAKLMCKQ